MKPLSVLFLSAALIFATSPAAFAYSLSPPSMRATLEGKLTFHPTQGQPITCEVTFGLKTKMPGHSIIHDVKFKQKKCGHIFASGLPWRIGPNTPNGGVILEVSFGGMGNGCGNNQEHFGDNDSGAFSFNVVGDQCLSGTMTSSPPITIVP